MGDADIARNMVEDPDLEALFNEALQEVEEEMDRLCSLINSLHIKNYHMTSQVSCWQNFHECFTALNLFAIPVILALGIAYMTAGMLTPGSAMETGVETLIMILMYVSMSLGLPLYVFTLYAAYFTDANDGPSRSGTRNDVNESEFQESLETVVQFRALNRARRRQSLLEPEEEEEDEDEEEEEVEVRGCNLQSDIASEGFTITVEEMPAAFNNKQIKSADHQLIDLDVEKFVDASDVLLAETFQQKADEELCDLHLLIFSPHKQVVLDDGGHEGEMVKIGHTHERSVRSISIENIGEGDRNTPFTKDASNFVEIYQTEQGFGL